MAFFNLDPGRDKIDRGEAKLRGSEYPGRVIIMGRSAAKLGIQAYALTGRSEESRNRIFTEVKHDNGYVSGIRTVAPNMTETEMAAVEGAENIYYPAMDEIDGVYVVTNGPQTPYVLDSLTSQTFKSGGFDLEAAIKSAPIVEGDLDLSSYEKDRLSTPRIAGAIYDGDQADPWGLSIIRKPGDKDKVADREAPLYFTFQGPDLQKLRPGVGFGIQTYNGDRANPKSYTENPYPFPLEGNNEEIAHFIWDVLNEETRVSVVVRQADLKYGQIDYSIIDDNGVRSFPMMPED